MKQECLGVAIAAGLTLPAFPFGAWAQSCAPGPATVQILGSGGPVASRERASSSYLLWVGGEARMLIDAGGGAYLRFGQSGAKLTDLALVAISHLHPDHVSDLPALLWMSRIPIDLGGQPRNEPLPIVGPSGNGEAPDFATFVARLFEKGGAFQVLGTILNASAQGRTMRLLSVSVVDVDKPEPSTVFKNSDITVTASGIPHNDMPTLAYRVETPAGSVVFSSDQTGTDPKFVDFARNANLLIMHMMVPAGYSNPFHATPAVVGRIAREAGVGRLIVSHIGQLDLDAAIGELRRSYTGPLTIGADLQCTPIVR
jgi:ribonuclease BN (tRNA processing enzyme)